MNRAMAGGDENSSMDVGLYLTTLELLRALFPKATIFNVHHEG